MFLEFEIKDPRNVPYAQKKRISVRTDAGDEKQIQGVKVECNTDRTRIQTASGQGKTIMLTRG
jgi:hypothetical protein